MGMWHVWEEQECIQGFGAKIRWKETTLTDVGKYSFVNRTITNWIQLPASLLASFPCKLSTFRKRVKNVVTGKGIGVWVECK